MRTIESSRDHSYSREFFVVAVDYAISLKAHSKPEAYKMCNGILHRKRILMDSEKRKVMLKFPKEYT